MTPRNDFALSHMLEKLLKLQGDDGSCAAPASWENWGRRMSRNSLTVRKHHVKTAYTHDLTEIAPPVLNKPAFLSGKWLPQETCERICQVRS